MSAVQSPNDDPNGPPPQSPEHSEDVQNYLPGSQVFSSTGDVILVLQDDSRLRVQASILRNASETFRAMLGPHFNEGQNLSCENPKRIPLPEDNPSAMKLLCAILHHRYEPEETPSFKLIQALAEAVDKYLCVSSTTAITTMWLHVILVRASVWDFAQLVELLAASYLLKSDSAFHETSKHLVLKYSSTLALDFDHAMTRLPWKSIGKTIFFLSHSKEKPSMANINESRHWRAQEHVRNRNLRQSYRHSYPLHG
ncbi:uncharacterized protein J3D65DRAFT_30831 [Phyllosticta citribraziliensis]|uniref:BTB domain-containing protein n=1 Tax=Phyllosticta citribraziliensis TaxID=989973 RepID=A0ABR1MDJ4_9PEZI